MQIGILTFWIAIGSLYYIALAQILKSELQTLQGTYSQISSDFMKENLGGSIDMSTWTPELLTSFEKQEGNFITNQWQSSEPIGIIGNVLNPFLAMAYTWIGQQYVQAAIDVNGFIQTQKEDLQTYF